MFTEEEKVVLQSYGHQDKANILICLQKDMDSADETTLEFLRNLLQVITLASSDHIKEALNA